MRIGSRSLGESPSSIATKCRQCFSAIPLSADEVCFRSNIGCRRFETIPSKPISQALAKTSVEA
jgi:hypothetical protein